MTNPQCAREIMNPEVITVQDDMTVLELTTLLTDQEISGAPVVNDRGQLIGVVSVTDVARVASEGGERVVDGHTHHFFVRGWEEEFSAEEFGKLHLEEESLLVRDIMTPSVFAVEAETPIASVARSMMDSHLHRMLVVENQKVVGIISTSDMLQLLTGE